MQSALQGTTSASTIIRSSRFSSLYIGKFLACIIQRMIQIRSKLNRIVHNLRLIIALAHNSTNKSSLSLFQEKFLALGTCILPKRLTTSVNDILRTNRKETSRGDETSSPLVRTTTPDIF